MAECLQSEIVSITTCSICLEKLTKPKYLPCLHTFCESCILAYISSGFEKGNKQNIECPTCRTVMSVPNENCSPEEWTEALPLNFLISGLLENEKIQRPEKQCMVCERIGKKIKAVSICKDCSDLLCANCTDYHKAIKSTSVHVVSTLGEQPVDINSVKTFKNACSEHKNKELELYCEDHGIPCCSLCVSINHRKCEKVLLLEDAAKGFAISGILTDMKQQLNQVEKDINTVLADRKACLASLEIQYAAEKKKLENMFDDFIEKASGLKTKREAELLKVFIEVRENVDTTLTIFQNKQKIVENEKQILDISMKKASEVQLMIEVNKLKHQIEKHKELIQNTSDKIIEYKLTVKNEKELPDILNQFENVCQIGCDKKQKSMVFVSNIKPQKSEVNKFDQFKNIGTGWVVDNEKDAISFSVSKEIELCGFLSYGCHDGNSTCQATASMNVFVGEEEYEKLFCQRAKLFRFDKDVNQWKEKGLGEMKILQHKENKRYRLLLRREQVLKLACNQWLSPELSFKPLPTSETSWCWVGQDFSDNEPVIEQLAIKFKTIEMANQFKQMIDTCQSQLKLRGSSATEKGDSERIPVTVAQPPEEDLKKEEQEEQEEDDDDEDYTTEEEEILFEKRIIFYSKEENWKAIGLGIIKVLYDEDVNGNRIMVELDNKKVVCNHLVDKETSLVINKKDCQWSPIDFSTDEPLRRNFRAQFSSYQAVAEFNKFVQEGRQLAVESDISERNMVTYPREITFPEVKVHGGSSQ